MPKRRDYSYVAESNDTSETPQPRNQEPLTLSVQQDIATALAFANGKLADGIARRIDIGLLDPPLGDIAARCIAYRKKYGEAPGHEHIDDVFTKILSNKDDKRYTSYQRILSSMLRLQHKLNLRYVSDLIEEFMRRRRQRVIIQRAAEIYQNGPEDAGDQVAALFEKGYRETRDPDTSAFALIRASDLPDETVQWFWPDYIPIGMAMAICGLPDVGKSVMMCEMAARLSRGGKWPDGSLGDKPQKVLIITTEDSLSRVVRPRLIAAGANMDNVTLVRMRGKVFSLKRDLPLLEEWLEEEDFGAVFIEPFYAFTGDKTDTYRDSEIQQIMAPVLEMLERYQTTLVANIHLNKNREASAIDRVTGARGTGGTFRVIHLLHPDAESDDRAARVFVKVKNNHAPPDVPGFQVRLQGVVTNQQKRITAPRIVWGEEDERTADQVLQAKKDTDKVDMAEQFLCDALANGPVSETEIRRQAQRAGYSWRTVERAKKTLKVTARKRGFFDGWRWELPEQKARSRR